ncbi:hypothetical protein [Actinoplanes sp. NPDC049265]|uniref:hypothetical protein n=1 Tax=Actinoplanes sp. NPDC049265 TaxID=3363902 RepID=UPI003719FD20
MTRTMNWRMSVVAVCAALGLATVFGPGEVAVTRPGAGDSVSAADSIRAVGMLADAAPGVSKRDETV